MELPEGGEGKTGAAGQRQKLPVRTQESGRGRGALPRAPPGTSAGESSCGSSHTLASWRQAPGGVVVTEEVEDGKLPRAHRHAGWHVLREHSSFSRLHGEVTMRPSEPRLNVMRDCSGYAERSKRGIQPPSL